MKTSEDGFLHDQEFDSVLNLEKAADLSNKFEAHILANPGTSFAGLEWKFGSGPGKDFKGVHSVTMDLKTGGFIVLWAGVNPEFTKAIGMMIARGKVEWETTTPLVYMIDGAVPQIPLLKRIPKKPLKEPKWVPIVFNPKRREGAGK